MKPTILKKRLWQLQIDVNNILDQIDIKYYLGQKPSREILDMAHEMAVQFNQLKNKIKEIEKNEKSNS